MIKYYSILRYTMGRKYQGDKLYWRMLRNGKYTWKKANPVMALNHLGELELVVNVRQAREEEE